MGKKRVFPTHRELDGCGQVEPVAVQVIKKRNRNPNYLLLDCLVEFLCEYVETEPNRKQLLYEGLCKRFNDLKLGHFFCNSIEALHPIRTQFRYNLLCMINKERKNVMLQLGSLKPTGNLPLLPFPTPGANFFQQISRYRNDFKELEKIAQGGFGIVCKVQSRIDRKEYAVKKILLDHNNMKISHVIMREVEINACLSHPNIVNYKTSWLEIMQPEDKLLLHNLSSEESSHSCTSNGHSKRNYDYQEEQMEAKYSETVEETYIKSTVTNFSTKEARNVNEPGVNFFYSAINNNDLHMAMCCTTQTAATTSVKITEISTTKAEEGKLVSHASQNEVGINVIVTGVDENFDAKQNQHRCRHESGSTVKSHSDSEVHSTFCLGIEEAPRAKKHSGSINNFRKKGYFRQFSWEIPSSVVLYIQMELCSISLKDWLERRNEERNDCVENRSTVLGIFEQVLKGVEYIHSKGIIHRDLKPANILFSLDNTTIKIVDFGLAKVCMCSDENRNGDTLYLQCMCCNKLSSGIGTGIYIAPEQRNGNDYDKKADMYSLGIILLELVYSFSTTMEKQKCVEKLKKERELPKILTDSWPEMAEMIKKLTDSNPLSRPIAKKVLESCLFDVKNQEVHKLKNKITLLENSVKEKDDIIERQKAEILRLKKILEIHGVDE